MADVTVEGTILSTSPDRAGQQLVFISSTVGYCFFIFSTDSDMYYRKTSDGGATWAAAVLIEAGTMVHSAVWYDRWTPGNSGTLIHIIYYDSASTTFEYDSLDTSGDSLSGAVTIQTATLTTPVMTITRAKSGNLIVAATAAAGAGTWKSTAVGASASFSSITTLAEGTSVDFVKLFPANLADTSDVWCLFIDITASELSLKTYDDSGNSWAENAIATAVTSTPSTGAITSFAGSIRHSDGHLLAAAWNDLDVSTADLLTWDITDGSTITAKTNVSTNVDDMYGCALYINNATNDVYCFYLGKGDGSETYTATVSVFYKKSTDGMATWGSETAYSEGAADDYRNLWCDLGNQSGNSGRVGVVWFDDDDNDYWWNSVNAITISVSSAAITGTATASITESDIVTGGKTIIITLTGDTWVTSGATFDGQRANIASGIDSAQSEANGWDAVVKAGIDVGDVVRTSDTVVTVTLDPEATYDITAQETITVTIPGSALTGAAQIIATPTFTVDPVGGTAVKDLIGVGYIPGAR